MKSYVLILAFLICTAVNVFAQRAPSISSPEVHADGTATFKYYSRAAKSVLLSAEFLSANVPMTGDTSGVWTITTSAIKPDIYPYFFIVDSIQVADPNNTNIFANERFKRSIVEIPGKEPALYSLTNVPHGKVSYNYYKSDVLKTTRQVLIYTPPGYNASGKIKYPVLYLIMGDPTRRKPGLK